MYTYIKKRDGRRVAFRQAKIMSAIERAGLETGEFGEAVADKLAEKVVARATKEISEKVPTVEQIQDIVEEILLESRYKKTAKAYIIYRDQHKKLREIASGAHVDLVDQYLAKLDWRVNENSNMDYSLQGLNNYISSEVSKTYWLNKIYSPEIGRLHRSGDMHIHDLNLVSVYCVGWDLQDVLRSGFTGVTNKISSRPAKHFRTALGQVVNFFYTTVQIGRAHV